MFLRTLFLILIFGALCLSLPRIVTGLSARKRIYSIQDTAPKQIAVVFGAGLYRNGTPTPVLQDRVATAVELYFAGKIEKILMSGDNRFVFYNEPLAMKNYAMSLGVPEQAIVLDYAGHSTYDTCYRARNFFGLKDVILVTQGFHLPRALYLCRAFGIQAVGVSADRRVYRLGSRIFWNLREFPATLNAWVEIYLTRPQPKLGQPDPIFPPEAQ